MTDCEKLFNILRDRVVLQPQKVHNQWQLSLSEPGHSTIIISGLPPASFAFKSDAFPHTGDFFQGANGEAKRSDYVLLAHDDSSHFALFIELKAGKPGNTAVGQQLKGSDCLLQYIMEIAYQFYGHPRSFERAHKRYIAFLETEKAAKTTSLYYRRNDGDGKSPENFKKIRRTVGCKFRDILA